MVRIPKLLIYQVLTLQGWVPLKFDIPTKLVWSAVGDGGPLGSVDDVGELQDVDGGPGGNEQHTEGNTHLVEPVQLAVLK